jgi:hypothetical protein
MLLRNKKYYSYTKFSRTKLVRDSTTVETERCQTFTFIQLFFISISSYIIFQIINKIVFEIFSSIVEMI